MSNIPSPDNSSSRPFFSTSLKNIYSFFKKENKNSPPSSPEVQKAKEAVQQEGSPLTSRATVTPRHLDPGKRAVSLQTSSIASPKPRQKGSVEEKNSQEEGLLLEDKLEENAAEGRQLLALREEEPSMASSSSLQTLRSSTEKVDQLPSVSTIKRFSSEVSKPIDKSGIEEVEDSDSEVEEKNLETTSQKVGDVATSIIRKFGDMFVKFIAQGKAKVVWVSLDPSHDKVYITATSRFKLSEIEKEVEFNVRLQKKLQFLEGSTHATADHLAIDMTVYSGPETIEGQKTFVAAKAEGDLEKFLKGNIRLEGSEDSIASRRAETAKLGEHLLEGLSSLQALGMLHGDLKPDNCLIYREENKETGENELVLKLADFGKAKEIPAESASFVDKVHTGNQRYAAPENVRSEKGEVFSGALLLIKMFEQPYLTAESPTLIPVPTPEGKKATVPPSPPPAGQKEREGIEKFVVENPFCPQIDGNDLTGRAKVIAKVMSGALGPVPLEKLQDSQVQVHKYITALIDKMKIAEPEKALKFDALGELLTRMTFSDPTKRPTMKEALEQFKALGIKT